MKPAAGPKLSEKEKRLMGFSDQLIILRKHANLTQEDLADKVGVSRQSVSKWETGESFPDLPKMLQLSDALGVSLDVLCGKETTDGNNAAKDETEASNGETSKRSKWLNTKGVIRIMLLLISLLAAGFVGYSIGKGANGEENTIIKTIPEKLKVYDESFEYDGKTLTCTFVTNYESDTVWYRVTMSDRFDNKKDALVTHKDGVIKAVFEDITGTGTRIDLIMKEGSVELKENVAQDVSVTKDLDNGKWYVNYSRSKSY